MTDRHIMIASPDRENQVFTYSPGDMREIYTPQENFDLGLGRVVFKNGSLHADMNAITAIAMQDHLENA